MHTYGAAYGAAICHHGPVEVMKIGKMSIWAGSMRDMKREMGWSLRLRFNDTFNPTVDSILYANQGAKAILPASVTEGKYPPTLDIDWEDFGVPAVGMQWWKDLVKAITAMPEEGDIGIYCYGGHGRTGTALSILATLSNNVPVNEDPVDWVRRNYCAEAVESWIQIDYVKAMTGREVVSVPTSVYKQKLAASYNKGTGTASTNGNSLAKEANTASMDGSWKENDDGTWEIDWDKATEDAQKITEKTSVFNPGNVQSNSAKELMVALNKKSRRARKGRHR